MLNGKLNIDNSAFLQLCKSHKIKTLFAFGSSVTENFTNESDVDLLVEVDENDPLIRGALLMDLWDKFKLIFNRKVDLLTVGSIRNPVFLEQVEKTKQLIYDGTKEKILL